MEQNATWVTPVSEAPKPIVKKPRLRKYGGAEPGKRVGKGFSIAEIAEVGLTPAQARSLGIHVDARRKTKWEWNVEALRRYLQSLGLQA